MLVYCQLEPTFSFNNMHLKMSSEKWQPFRFDLNVLTHWGRVTHICVGKLTIIGSDNGLSPGRRQAIIWTNAGILLIGPLGTNFTEILNKIQTFSFKKIRLKMSSAKCCPFRLGPNVLILPPHQLKVVILTTFRATSDEHFIKMRTHTHPLSPQMIKPPR